MGRAQLLGRTRAGILIYVSVLGLRNSNSTKTLTPENAVHSIHVELVDETGQFLARELSASNWSIVWRTTKLSGQEAATRARMFDEALMSRALS